MAPAVLSLLIVGAAGGLGRAIVREALSRGARVSVLVRDAGKFAASDAGSEVPRLAGVHVGSGDDPAVVAAAARAAGATVVVGCKGGDAPFARGVARGAAAAGVPKVVTVAGATNLADADGVTPLWHKWAARWPPAESAYHAHAAAIAETRAAAAEAPGLAYVVFCPPYMAARGAVSEPPPAIVVNAEGASFISYEDAAWIMMEAAGRADLDNTLITGAAAAPAARAGGEL